MSGKRKGHRRANARFARRATTRVAPTCVLESVRFARRVRARVAPAGRRQARASSRHADGGRGKINRMGLEITLTRAAFFYTMQV